MGKSITVSYSYSDTLFQIPLAYKIEMAGNVQTITCSVDSRIIPQWLQLRKFEMISLNDKNVYTPLFNEISNEKNSDTVMFIDKVYIDIMSAEKLKVKVFAADVA